MITDKEIREKYKSLTTQDYVSWSIENDISSDRARYNVLIVETIKTIKVIALCLLAVFVVYLICNWGVQNAK